MFKGKTVMVTGAGKNIGREIALDFAKSGANVIVCDYNGECAEDTAKEIMRMGAGAMTAVCDVRDRAKIFEYVGKAVEKIDLVHWNNGLWDVLRLNGDEPLTPVDYYVYMLEMVHKKIKLFFPNAKIIFAATTPVIEKNSFYGWERRNAEIEKYNNEAKKLMDRLGAEFNDLYAVAKRFDESFYADRTHFNEKGARILADEIIKKIQGEYKQ